MSQQRFGTRLVHRLSRGSLSELQGWLEDYDYRRGETGPYRRTEATRIGKGLEMERARRIGEN